MKLAVIGKGTVGSAVYTGLEQLKHDMCFFDPAIPGSQFHHVLDSEAAFICVPTNQTANGDCDVSIVEQVIQELSQSNYTGLVAIKSTVIPGTTDRLSAQYPNLRICNVPEFLRARFALKDFVDQDILVIGSTRKQDYEIIKEIHGPYAREAAFVTPTESEIIKYFNNVHHAMQVTFANITYEVCAKLNANYMNVYNTITKRDCINKDYLMVNETTRGYGGHCLPKDTAAWNNLIKNLGIGVELIQSVINDNEKFK